MGRLLLTLCLLLASVCAAHADITTGLVAWYRLDEAQGVNPVDSSGNGNHATLPGGTQNPTATAGCHRGGCLTFNGTQYVTTPITTAFTNFTACAWFYASSDTTFMRILDNTYDGGFWLGHGNASNAYGGGVRDAGSPYGRYVTLGQNAWHHLCTVRNGTTHTIYADRGAVTTSGTVTSTALNTLAILIGTSQNAGGDSWVGMIDDVYIFNRALTMADMNEIYDQSDVADITTGLVLHYRFNETSGTTATDSGSGAQNGTLAGGVTRGIGMLGPAVHFADAGTDVVTAAGTLVYAPQAAPWSFAAWWRLDSFRGASAYHLLTDLRTNTTNTFEIFLTNAPAACGNGTGIQFGSAAPWPQLRAAMTPTAMTAGWHHLVLTYNGSGAGTASNFAMYVDGALVTIDTGCAGGVTTQQTSFGDIGSAPGTNDWVGSLDEVRVYTRALTATDVRMLVAFGRVKHAIR